MSLFKKPGSILATGLSKALLQKKGGENLSEVFVSRVSKFWVC